MLVIFNFSLIFLIFCSYAFASQAREYFEQVSQVLGPLTAKGDCNLKLTILNAVINDTLDSLTCLSEIDPKMISERVTSLAGEQSTFLHLACSVPVADWLIKNGAQVNAFDAAGYTPLHRAVYKDDCELVRLLLSSGADPALSVTNAGQNAFQLALKLRKSEIARIILQSKPEIIRAFDTCGRSGYYYVANVMPELFLELDPMEILNHCPPEALTAIINRKAEVRLELLKRLIRADCEKLRFLVQGMNMDLAKLLLVIGDLIAFEYYLSQCPIELISAYTPISCDAVNLLQSAIILKRDDFVKLLLNRGFDPRTCTLFAKKSCLDLAVSSGDPQIISLIKSALD